MLKTRTFGDSIVHIICLPGGPGLSSSTLEPLIDLGSDFCIHLLDYCGTNGSNNELRSLDELSKMIHNFINSLNGKKILLGHSYGGFLASSITLITEVSGLVCLGTPFSDESLNQASFNYSKSKSPNLFLAEKRWLDEHSVENFNQWLAEYDNLYFCEKNLEAGRNLLLKDLSSPMFFINNSLDIPSNQQIIKDLKLNNIPKLLLAGELDGLLSPYQLRKDAENCGFNFREIPNANHFMFWDQKEIVISEITKFIKTTLEVE